MMGAFELIAKLAASELVIMVRWYLTNSKDR